MVLHPECASLDLYHIERHASHGERLDVAGLLVKNEVNKGIHVGDVDFAVVVHIGCGIVGAIVKYEVNDRVHVGNIHLIVAVHVAIEWRHFILG